MQVATSRNYHHMLGNIDVIDLLDGKQDGDDLSKAGVLPFIREGNSIMFFLMRPVPQRPDLGPPEFQIAKGTRRIREGGQWCDITSRHMPLKDLSRVEDLLTTAVREGQEELGLRVDNIARLYKGRVFAFRSATTGKAKQMLVHAVEVLDRDQFDEPNMEAGSRPECRWLSPEACRMQAREDHYVIVDEFYRALSSRN